jgi:glycosyltransferase involved in cell wall biosynthesis
MLQLAKSILRTKNELILFSLSSKKHPYHKLPLKLLHEQTIKLKSEPSIPNYLSSLIDSDGWILSRYKSKKVSTALQRIIEKYNIEGVIFDGLFTTLYREALKDYPDLILLYRAHNLEAELWKKRMTTLRPLQQKFMNSSIDKLEQYESEVFKNFQKISTISIADQKILSQRGIQSTYLPFGLDLAQYKPRKPTGNRPLKIAMVGSMDWLPNVVGMKWFLEECWPLIEDSGADIELNIAGKGLKSNTLNITSGTVNIHGEVASMIDFLRTNHLLVVPLFEAGGIRIKNIEALALGLPVIGTTSSFGGMALNNDSFAVTCDTAEDFYNAILLFSKSGRKLEMASKEASNYARKNFDIRRADEVLSNLLNK